MRMVNQNKTKGEKVMFNKNATDQEFAGLLQTAHEAGLNAGYAKKPTPMVVSQHENMLDDNSPVKESWYVPQGVCGFAWVVTNEHGNGKFVKYLKKYTDKGDKCYYGGFYVCWVREFGQSMEQKEAYADAYVTVLKEAGLDCYSDSRMD